MRTIVITNQKGGCGKTTTAVNLAAALAQMGRKVLMLDLDPQAHATLGLGCKPENCKRTIYHSLARRQIPISKVIINTETPGLDLAPSSILLAKAEQELIAVSRKEFILADQLETVSNKYDICVIDCPPSLGLLTFSALVASTDVIVPVQAQYYALEGLKQMLETIKTARKRFYPCPVKILGILLTFVEDKAALSLQVEQQMRAFFGDLVFDTVVHRTISLAEAPSAGESISGYAPQSMGAAEYRTLAEEVSNGEYKRKRKVPTDIAAIVYRVQIPSEAAGKAESIAITEEHKKAERHAKALAEAENRLKAEIEARYRAEELARREAQARVAAVAEEQKKARDYAEALAEVEKKLKAEVEAENRLKAEVEAQSRAEELARREAQARVAVAAKEQEKAREYAEALAEVEKKLKAEVEARSRVEEMARAEARRRAEAEAKAKAEGAARFKAEEKLRAEAKELARLEAKARTAASAKDQKKAREYAEALAEVQKKLKAAVEARSRAEEEAQAEAQRRAEAEEKANAEAVELARLEAKARAAARAIARSQAIRRFLHSRTVKVASVLICILLVVAVVMVVINKPPMAKPYIATMQEDTPTLIPLVGSDPDAEDQLTYSVVTGPSHGSLSGIGPDMTYTPESNYSGPDSFTFRVNDGEVDSKSATVSITVAAVDDVPAADHQSVTTKVDRSASINLTGNDVDSETLRFAIATQPKHGTIAFGSDFARNGKIVYTPEARYTGSDSFTFKVNDGTTDSTPATVSINVTLNQVPIAEPQTVTMAEDAPDVVTLGGNDPDGDTVVYSVVTDPVHGALSGTAPNLTYTPNRDFHGPDSFTFKVNDGAADSAPATVSITVTKVNDPSVAASDHVTTSEDTSTAISLRGIDPDGDRLTYSIVTRPSHGSLSGTGPNVVYEPDQNFNGPDNFTFKINDGTTDSVPATISIMVIAAADAPIANDVSVTVHEDKEQSIILTGTDPDGDPLTFAVLRTPAHGTLIGNAPNVIYTPDPNFSWLDSFTFRVNDGTADSAPATVRISVTPVNDPPKAHDDAIVTQEDTPATIDVLANDTEVDNELLKITAASKSANGSVTVNPTGTLTYTPNADFYGKDTFTYIVTDREGMTDTATVRVEVISANDMPLITSKPVIVAMVGVQYTYDVDATDPDRTDKLTYSLTSRPLGMTIEPATGVIRWTPIEGQKDETFAVAVKVTDGDSVCDVQQYEVSVNPTPPRAATLTVVDAYDHNTRKWLSADGRIDAIKASDDKRIEGGYGSTISYSFSKVTIPPGAKVAKVMLYAEHYEDESFPLGRLKWEIGKGWPDNPTVWFAANGPIREGKQQEATDSWDITSFGNTAEEVNSLQLQIKNTDSISRKKTFVNYIRVAVEWDWPVSERSVKREAQSKSKDEADDGLVLIRR
jgi:cellulose biosynthesis protein BcsQ